MASRPLKFECVEPTYAMYETLKEVCLCNSKYFSTDESENGQKLFRSFGSLIDLIDLILPQVDRVRKVSGNYDFSPARKGNGYRSFVSVVDSSVEHSLNISRQVSTTKDTLLFRKHYYAKEVEACCHLIASLSTCLKHVMTLISWSDKDSLFPRGTHSPEELFNGAEPINQYVFYGRCLGFQFHPSMRSILKGISICMAGFSEAYYTEGNIINSVITGGQYVIDPEVRAKRIVNISQYADVQFCKAFWFLAESEIMHRVPSIIAPSLAINRIISIQPETLDIITTDGSTRSIPAPSVHIGLKPLHVRLLSTEKRDDGEKSPGILFHVHGGGFVSQSSKSHESYLRNWAKELNVPILSIDYSLAPEAPFPRAVQEVFYAYCWMLNNLDQLGTTGHRIVFAGDSAGANLVASLVIQCIEKMVRKPDGLVLVYAPVLVSFVLSPARLLCLMDPLLPFGFMMRCLKGSKAGSLLSALCSRWKPRFLLQSSQNSLPPRATSLVQNSPAYACPPTNANQSPGTKQDQSVCDTYTVNGLVNNTMSQDAASPSDPTELRAEYTEHNSRRKSSDTTCSAASFNSETTPTLDKQFVNELLQECVDRSTQDNGNVSPGRNGRSVTESLSNGSSTLKCDIKTDPTTAGPSDKKSINTRPSVVNAIMSAVTAFKLTPGVNTSLIQESGRDFDGLMARSPSDEFIFNVPRDPLLSPYWASDDVIKQFPNTRIVSVELDPCLDDCVMFARKLRTLGCEVDLDVLHGLPHGFLNFSRMSKEAQEGSKLCVTRIKELMNIEGVETGIEPNDHS